MASDVMRVRLHLRQIRVLGVLVDTPEELRVRVESTVRRPRCPHCGFKCHRVHDTREREVRDLEVSGRRTTLVWVRRRFVCGGCDSRWLEEHPEFDGRLTRRLAQRLVADAEVMTIRAVVRRHGVSWPSVNALVRAWSGLIAEHRRSQRCLWVPAVASLGRRLARGPSVRHRLRPTRASRAAVIVQRTTRSNSVTRTPAHPSQRSGPSTRSPQQKPVLGLQWAAWVNGRCSTSAVRRG